MSQKRKTDVSKIVEDYRNKFPQAERQVLKDAILKKHTSLNTRTLDRHLKKAFEKKASNKIVAFQSNNSKEQTLSVTGWDLGPDFSFSPQFEAAHRKTREAYEVDKDGEVKFPQVSFNWHNFSQYQLRIRLEVRVFLGGHYLGLIKDPKGYYNGEASIPAEPLNGRLRDGRFTLPPECTESTEETTIEVRARILDQNDLSKKEYIIIKSWSYDPKTKDWFYEPKSFAEEVLKMHKSVSSWDSLLKEFASIGAYLTEVELGKHRKGNDSHLETGQFEQIYDKSTIQGIMMLKGAKTMQNVAKIAIPEKYEAFLFTQASIKQEDKLKWQNLTYDVETVEVIYDVHNPSYNIAKLVEPFKPWVMGVDY